MKTNENNVDNLKLREIELQKQTNFVTLASQSGSGSGSGSATRPCPRCGNPLGKDNVCPVCKADAGSASGPEPTTGQAYGELSLGGSTTTIRTNGVWGFTKLEVKNNTQYNASLSISGYHFSTNGYVQPYASTTITLSHPQKLTFLDISATTNGTGNPNIGSGSGVKRPDIEIVGTYS